MHEAYSLKLHLCIQEGVPSDDSDGAAATHRGGTFVKISKTIIRTIGVSIHQMVILIEIPWQS